jgi:transposase
MFIRRVKTRTTENGTAYYSHRLVESYRVGNRVRQRTLLNLGNHFNCPREQWPELTRRIEQILLGQDGLFNLDALEPEEQAHSIVKQLLHKYSRTELLAIASRDADQIEGSASKIATDKPEYHAVDLGSLEHSNSRSVGGEALALSAVKESELFECLTTLGFNRSQLHAAIGNVVGRMLQPGSELSTHAWLQKHSALGDLLGFDYEKQGLSALYRAADLLWANHEVIETHLYQRHVALFGIEECITLYDLTNTFFEGTGKYNDLAAYGHSKEKRSDCPLVTLALVLDGSGFTRRSRIYPGNVSEPATLQQMVEQLRSPLGEVAGDRADDPNCALDLRSAPTIVMDAGIASEGNIQWLRDHGFNYIVVSRKHRRLFDEEQCVAVKEREHDTVRAYRVETDQDEVELYCHSERKAAKESAMQQRASQRLEAELQHLVEGLDRPRRLKRLDKVHEKIGRLRQKYSQVARYYDVTVDGDADKNIATAIHVQRITPAAEDKHAHPGVYCLRSNQTQWDEQQLWSTYTMLTDLEAVFRSLKSELGLRPVYHQKTHRVEAHLFITLLAYNLVHQLRCRLKSHGIHDSWDTIRTTMGTQVRITTGLRGENGKQIHIRKSCRSNADQQVVLRALGLKGLPGNTERTVVVP